MSLGICPSRPGSDGASIDMNWTLSETDTGTSTEITAGNHYPLYRKKILIGELPNNTTKSVAHGVSNIGPHKSIYRAGGTNSSTGITLPLPYVDFGGASEINMSVDNTNVNVITGLDRRVYDDSFVLLEYTKTTDTPTPSPR
jgi:hypothetical protein